MPIIVPSKLPAAKVLRDEGISVIGSRVASHQDIRPLRICILNIMPTKEATETQWLRLLGASPLQLEITLLHTETYKCRNTSEEHMSAFYTTFSDIKEQQFDGLVITGAPVETLNFSEVHYWEELQRIFTWSKTHVFSTLHVCWGAQAGLYHHYEVPKHAMEQKLTGVFGHQVLKKSPLTAGFDDVFCVPHSRYTETRACDIERVSELSLAVCSPEAGVYAVTAYGLRQVFLTGHPEYDKETLGKEYRRDLGKFGTKAACLPRNYFPNDDPAKSPVCTWRGHARLTAQNWLHWVYQKTPYNLESIEPLK